MLENRARYLAGPEHHGVIRGDLDGGQELLQKHESAEGARFDEEAQCDITGSASFGLPRERDEDGCVRFGR